MNLTADKIEDLYRFTRKHFVKWYDLQTELVDHLANDIEQILQKNPNLSFVEARDKAFKKFGVFGFMKIVEEKQKQLEKRYWKLIFNEFKTFFTIPKIAVFISLFFLLYSALYYLQINRIVWSGFLLMIAIFGLIHLFRNRKALQKKVKQTGKKYLFEEIISNLGGVGGALTLPVQLALNVRNIHQHNVALWLSLSTTIFILFLYLAIFKMPNKIREILSKEYPLYQ